ncbi:MAG: hypothetical protein J6T10_13895, partial [Methanobrevibacter sp.]|nr:hypothetical protein [Methanobrevibacter sp.]
VAKSSFSLIIGVLIPRTTVPTHLIFITPNKHKGFVGLFQQPINFIFLIIFICLDYFIFIEYFLMFFHLHFISFLH